MRMDNRVAAAALVDAFASRTGLDGDNDGDPLRRYLWTDAFATCTFLALADGDAGSRHGQLAQRLVDSLSWILVAGASLLSALGAWNQVQFGWGNVSTVVGYPVVLAMLPVLASMLVLAILAVVQLVNLWRRTPQATLTQAHVE